MSIKSIPTYIVYIITVLSFSCHTFTMFKPRTNIREDHRLAELAETIEKQLTEHAIPVSDKRIDYKTYKHQKKYPVHPLDKPGISKYTKNRKKERSYQ